MLTSVNLWVLCGCSAFIVDAQKKGKKLLGCSSTQGVRAHDVCTVTYFGWIV